MKRYEDLTRLQQELAVRDTIKTIIKGIINGNMGIKLSKDLHQRAMLRHVDYIKENGDLSRFQTFAVRSSVFKEDIDRIARKCAEKAFYTEPDEYVVYGIAE